MDWEDWLFALVVVFVLGGLLILNAPSDEEHARMIYEQQHPCINGVRYIVRSQGITPMIDPTTMQPQLCGAEKGER